MRASCILLDNVRNTFNFKQWENFIFRTILATKYRIVVPEKSTQLKTITSIARLTWILRRESRNDRTLNSEKLEKSTVKSILEACIACKLAVLNVLPSQACAANVVASALHAGERLLLHRESENSLFLDAPSNQIRN